MRLGEAAGGRDEGDVCATLFRGLRFFLGREVPREQLLLVLRAFGAEVGWDSSASPFSESDESITHQVRPPTSLLPRPTLLCSSGAVPRAVPQHQSVGIAVLCPSGAGVPHRGHGGTSALSSPVQYANSRYAGTACVTAGDTSGSALPMALKSVRSWRAASKRCARLRRAAPVRDGFEPWFLEAAAAVCTCAV